MSTPRKGIPMINRLRAWFYRRIHGEPVTPLSVLQSGPWTIDRINSELRGGFSRGHNDFGPNPTYGYSLRERGKGVAFESAPLTGGIDLNAWRVPFDHDAVQLAADDSSPGVHLNETLPGWDCACGGFGGPDCPEMTML